MLGRPTIFSQELADEICERLADGESLKGICASPEMPNRSTVFRWLASNKDFCDTYARAREAQADVLADEILVIADDGSNDTYETDDGPRVNQDVIARYLGEEKPLRFVDYQKPGLIKRLFGGK